MFPIAGNTAEFAGLAVIFGYPIPLVAAVLISEVRNRRGLYSVLAYLPVVIPPVVAVLLWKFFYDTAPTGVFNTMLHWVGVGPQPWIQSGRWAMPSLVLESTWANAGVTVIIYLAALTGVNSELYEAASTDGAGLWKKIWHLTLPQMRTILLVTMILQIIGTAQVFLEPHLFTSGGPNNATMTVLLLLIVGLGPILWLTRAAITPTQDTLIRPMSVLPHGFAWSNLSDALTQVDIGLDLWNTIVIAFGSLVTQIVVATTGVFALSVLRPKWGSVIMAALLTTLFVPTVVLLVPLYTEIVHPPLIGGSYVDNYYAIWLPEAAAAFNVLIMKRFFDRIPREMLEAARMDGAGPFRLFVSVVLPMSKPIFGVVSIFAVLASWKDFLWLLLVLTDANKQPLCVRLPTIQGQTEVGVFLAAMLIACIVPIVGFLFLQRSLLRGTGLSGALKG